jgi:hypothetical protein
MQELNHTYSTRTDAIRRAVDSHKDWIQDRLGIGLSDAVILSTDLSFCDAALPNLIGYSDRSTPITTAIRRLTERIVSVETAPSYLPLIELERERAIERWHSRSAPKHKESATYSLTWVDGPLAIHMRDLAVPVVALSVRYHEGPESTSESAQDVVVIPRSAVDVFIALLKTLRAADGKPRLRVGLDRLIKVHVRKGGMHSHKGESAGFSFAQLREAFIMAAQADFNNDGKIELDDLLNSVWSLRSSLLFGSMKPSAGFAVPRPVKRGNHD